MSVLSEGTIFSGKLQSTSAMRLDGHVEGDVICSNKLVIGINSLITGSIEAEEVVIGGKICGNVNAKSSLVLQATGSIEGDIFAKELLIEKGGMFKGLCQMGEAVTTIQLAAQQA